MDDLLTIAKVLGAAGGGTALLAWVFTRPHVIDGFNRIGELILRVRAQNADLVALKNKLLLEREVALYSEQRTAMADLRGQVVALRQEVTEWMTREHECREEVHGLRNELHVVIAQNRVKEEQNAALAAMNDKAMSIIRAAEQLHPEWFTPIP